MTGCGARHTVRGGHPLRCDEHRGALHWDGCCHMVWSTDPDAAPRPPVPGHALADVTDVNDNMTRWVCQCGTEGRATRSHPGEDLDRKARTNHRNHAKTRRGKNP